MENAAKELDVNTKLDVLQKKLADLETALDHLASRLVPVMHEESPAVDSDAVKTKASSCAMVETLQERISQVCRATNRINSLEQRLEI